MAKKKTKNIVVRPIPKIDLDEKNWKNIIYCALAEKISINYILINSNIQANSLSLQKPDFDNLLELIGHKKGIINIDESIYKSNMEKYVYGQLISHIWDVNKEEHSLQHYVDNDLLVIQKGTSGGFMMLWRKSNLIMTLMLSYWKFS